MAGYCLAQVGWHGCELYRARIARASYMGGSWTGSERMYGESLLLPSFSHFTDGVLVRFRANCCRRFSEGAALPRNRWLDTFSLRGQGFVQQ